MENNDDCLLDETLNGNDLLADLDDDDMALRSRGLRPKKQNKENQQPAKVESITVPSKLRKS